MRKFSDLGAIGHALKKKKILSHFRHANCTSDSAMPEELIQVITEAEGLPAVYRQKLHHAKVGF